MDQETQPIQGAISALKEKMQEYQQAAPDQSSIAQAMGMLGGKDILSSIGRAIQTPAYAGYCLQYVDDKTDNSNRQQTAIQDYQVRSQAGSVNTSIDIPKGARVYFNANQSNGGMGHVGLSNGDGSFTSATDDGVKTFSLKDWQRMTGQQFIGWSK